MIQLYTQEWESGPTLHFYKIEDNEILASGKLYHNYEEEEIQIIISSIFSYIKNKGYGTEIIENIVACYQRNYLSIDKKTNLYLKVRKDSWMINWYEKFGFEFHSEAGKISEIDFIWMKLNETFKQHKNK